MYKRISTQKEHVVRYPATDQPVCSSSGRKDFDPSNTACTGNNNRVMYYICPKNPASAASIVVDYHVQDNTQDWFDFLASLVCDNTVSITNYMYDHWSALEKVIT